MQSMQNAVSAYSKASAHRPPREQEAEVFLFVNASLRRARESAKPVALVRALADNSQLWTTVIGLVRDPDNRLPDQLRASLVSIGLAVQRETEKETPDLNFLIGVNENIAAGLKPSQ